MCRVDDVPGERGDMRDLCELITRESQSFRLPGSEDEIPAARGEPT
jgi:hypothetical protein